MSSVDPVASSSTASPSDPSPSVPFFKKKTRPTTSRRREESTLSESAPTSSTPASSEVVVPTRKTVANPLIQGTKRTYSQREDTDSGPDVKWKASGSNQAAAELEIEAIEGEDARALMKKLKREAEDQERDEDGLYHGATDFKSLIKKREDGGVPKAMRVGPQKSTSTIRTVTMMDYQPDVCKDYKETGYCGFGDTCKFLHDRGTYLQGWQLDKIAADPKKKVEDSDSDSDEEDIPWACYICRKPYTNPVVTRCTHYFCNDCAIKRFRKTPKCAACGAPTGGIFNRADKVIEKMRQKKKAKEEKEAEGDDEDWAGRSKELELEIPEM